MPKKSSHRPLNKPKITQTVVHPDAAGIDLASEVHYVAVPAERDPQPVRNFGTTTDQLLALADWLQQSGIRTVAMEATGVYRIPLFELLEARELEVCLVNAQHVRHVPCRKSDVQDYQWLQFLHSVALLRASFRPALEVCAVRTLLRHRGSLVQVASGHLLRLQKALDQMNVLLHRAVTDITDTTGLTILDAIIQGERDPQKLAAVRAPSLQEERRRNRRRAKRRLESRAALHPAPIARGVAFQPPTSRRMPRRDSPPGL